MSGILRYEGAAYFRQRLVLATLSGRPIRIEKIRHQDENPGLRGYEAGFLKLLEQVTNGSVIEISFTGTSVLYKPGLLSQRQKVVQDCETERAIGYYLEPLIYLAPFAKEPLIVTLKGITNNDEDPSVDTIRTVTLPLLKRFGIEEGVELKVNKRGAPPLGGGEIFFKCSVVKEIKPIQFLDFGKIKRVRGIAYSARISPQTSNRVVDAARVLLNNFIPDVFIYTDHYKGAESGLSPGYALCLVAETTNGVLLSAEKCASAGTSPEDVGTETAKVLFEEIHRGGCVDTQNQCLALLLMALSPPDVSKIRIGKLSPYTIHFLRHLKEIFGVTFKIKPDPEDGTIIMTCVGIGYTNVSRRLQ